MIRFIAFAILFTPYILYAQNPILKRRAGELIIQGKLIHMKEPVSFVYVVYFDGHNNRPDSVKVIDNKYSFRIQTGVTTVVTLFANSIENAGNLIDLVAEPSTLLITSIDTFSKATVSGSMGYQEYKKLERLRAPFSAEWMTFYQDMKKAKNDNNEETVKSLQQKMDSTNTGLTNMYYTYITGHPRSLILSYALEKYTTRLTRNATDEDIAKADLLYSKLPLNDKNSFHGKRIKKKLDSYKISIGIVAPAFVQNDTAGNPVSITEFQGKYVLLDFWASWCIPCRRENPNLVKLYNEYKDKGFVILSISLDGPGDQDKWTAAIRHDGLIWAQASDLKYWDNAVAKLYKVNAVPQNFLIDRDGKIIEIGLFGDELEKRLKQLFN